MTRNQQPAETVATWSIELNCECPGCTTYVDLLEYADFWDGRKLDVCEYMTERSKNLEVTCPKCGHHFTAELEY